MSTRQRFQPYQVILNNASASPANSSSGNMATSITSQPTIIVDLSCPSYAYSWTGTSPVGTISVQVSNDYSQNVDGTVKNAGTWTSIYCNFNGSSTPANSVAVSGNSGSGFIDVPITGAYAIRTIYTYTSGTGTLSAIISGKGA